MYDIRDTNNNEYVIRKLADGNCWMTQNLRLTGPKTLTSSDSNVSSNWDLPPVNETFLSSCEDTARNMVASSDASLGYGNYYNWYAATAGTGTCAMDSGSAESSICPKGWKLPTGGSGGQFQALFNQYNSSALMRGDPVNFVLSGGRDGSSTGGQGSYGYYWSSTAGSTNGARSLYLSSSSVNPTSNDYKYSGFTVRCAVI